MGQAVGRGEGGANECPWANKLRILETFQAIRRARIGKSQAISSQ